MSSLRLLTATVLLLMGSAALAQAKPVTRSDFLKNVDGRFAMIDTNHNGTIEPAEMAAEQQRELQVAKTAITQQLQQKFRQLDTNKDGQLSLAEFMAAAPPIRTNETPQQLMQALDANHDRKVSADEFKAPEIAKFNRLDINHDGVVTPAEQAAGNRK